MLPFTRREFLSLSATAIAALVSTHGEADDILNHPRGAVETLERPRVLKAAERYLHEQPETIVSTPASRSAGGLHDYFSEADYFWPDPKDPNGPYVNRDGESNPANFNAHRLLLIRLSIQAPALAAAWVLTKRPDFAAHAAAHLRAWFIEPSTRMNPNLQYAQAVHGVSTGRSYGIIDTLHLVEVAQAAIVLRQGRCARRFRLARDKHLVRAIPRLDANLRTWHQRARRQKQSRFLLAFYRRPHSHCSQGMMASFANAAIVSKPRSFPRRSHRTEASRLNSLAPSPMGIRSSISMRLECSRTCLSTGPDNLWDYALPDGRGVANCFHFMAPFIANKQSWPYRHDVQYFDDLPVRQPSLLFAGLAYRKQQYIDLWTRLDPDPTVPEVIRNHPIRQPVLWL